MFITIQGTDFASDGNQNCYLTSIDKIISRVSGYPSTMSANEYLNASREISAGDNTIKNKRIDSFTDYKIIEVTEYTNGIITTQKLTR